MKYRIEFTKTFEKHLKSLSISEKKMVAKKLKLLIENPFHPSLRTKKVQGIDNIFELSVNMDIRILGVIKGMTSLLLLI